MFTRFALSAINRATTRVIDMSYKTPAALLIGSLLLTGIAFAACPGPFVRDMKRAYENAKAAESQGKKEDALFFYHGAEGSVCENANPYEADAAKRAAPLGLELGSAAEKRGDFSKAEQLYEAGGHFAAADRVFMQGIRTRADEPGAYSSALEHFRNRREQWFAVNNAAAIEVTGPYSPDTKLVAEVDGMPAKAIETAIQKEATNFNEEFLRDYVQLTQSRSDVQSDAAAIQRTISAQQAFVQKWKRDDFIKASRDALQNLRMWGITVQDQKLAATVATKVAQISEQRARTLKDKYSGAPQLLEEAMGYYALPVSDNRLVEAKLSAVRALALKLGDDANAKNRYTLAAAYYDVAGAHDKAEAISNRGRQAAIQKMQPSIDQMHKQAEAARKAMQEQQPQNAGAKAANKKSAADLEKELGR